MADDLISALRALANRWAVRARDFNRDAKTETDATKAAYNRGYAEGYYRAATELATLLKDGADRLPVSSPAFPPEHPQPAAPPAPTVEYVAMPISEALLTLSYAGSEPRDIEARKDNTFKAIFSRWENLTDHERVEKLKRTDNRIVVISSGRLKDTHDPYIEFAYKSS